MATVLDQSQDLDGRELYRLTRNHALPPFCKQASAVEAGAQDAQNFAYPPRRLYPCDTPAATYISTLFFLDKQAEFKPDIRAYIDGQLDRFARFHGIAERITLLKQATVSNRAKSEADLTDDDFALILDGNRHYPLRNGHEVKRAAAFLKDNREIIPYTYRQKMACKILEKADRLGASLGSELDDYLEKQAGRGACSAKHAAAFLFERARLLKWAGKLDAAIQMGRLAKAALDSKESIHDEMGRVKLAGLVDRIDRESGLLGQFADLTPPEEVLFAITEKAASALRDEYVNTLTGNVYKRADLGQLKLDDIRDFMGNQFADAVADGGLFVSPEKIAAIVPTLPLADSRLFDRMLGSLGIGIAAKEAAHVGEGLSTEDLVALAG